MEKVAEENAFVKVIDELDRREDRSTVLRDMMRKLQARKRCKLDPDHEDCDLIALAKGDGSSDLTNLNVVCKKTKEAYTDISADLTASLDEARGLTNRMAESLAETNPNIDNSDEGIAIIRQSYKFDGRIAETTQPKYVLPKTPDICILTVAGQALLLEDLNDELAQAMDFNDFFANVYCTSYVDSLTIIADKSSHLVKAEAGALDGLIDMELMRLNGGRDVDHIADAAI